MKKVNHAPSKRYKEAAKLIDAKKTYALEEAVALVKKTATTKFDSSIEIHIHLNIDPKKSEQQIRSSVVLPHGTGRAIKVAVYSGDGDTAKAAKTAGADIVGDKELIEDIKAGKINFDVLIATPESMRALSPIAKILGPKGLMPNPKDGTVTKNVAEAITNMKKGKVNFKNDDTGNLHVLVGKASFTEQQLKENLISLLESVKKTKPTTVKSNYIKNLTLTSSMGPGIKVAA